MLSVQGRIELRQNWFVTNLIINAAAVGTERRWNKQLSFATFYQRSFNQHRQEGITLFCVSKWTQNDNTILLQLHKQTKNVDSLKAFSSTSLYSLLHSNHSEVWLWQVLQMLRIWMKSISNWNLHLREHFDAKFCFNDWGGRCQQVKWLSWCLYEDDLTRFIHASIMIFQLPPQSPVI